MLNTIITVYLIAGCIWVLYNYDVVTEAAKSFSIAAKVILYIYLMLIVPAISIYIIVKTIVDSIRKNRRES